MCRIIAHRGHFPNRPSAPIGPRALQSRLLRVASCALRSRCAVDLSVCVLEDRAGTGQRMLPSSTAAPPDPPSSCSDACARISCLAQALRTHKRPARWRALCGPVVTSPCRWQSWVRTAGVTKTYSPRALRHPCVGADPMASHGASLVLSPHHAGRRLTRTAASNALLVVRDHRFILSLPCMRV